MPSVSFHSQAYKMHRTDSGQAVCVRNIISFIALWRNYITSERKISKT